MLKFLSCCAAATAAAVLIAAPELPEKWRGVTKAKVTDDGSILKVVSPDRMGGFNGIIKNIANQRIEITAMVRGQGQVRPAVLGSMGWAYGAVVKLNDEFQMVSVVYTEVKSAFNFTVFSLTPGETTFEVKDIKVTATPPPELTAADIPGKLFIAHEMPARHGKVQKIADAHDGKAVWGKRYYHVITLPVPANENDLYYYCHVRKDSEKSMAILLKNVEQTVAYGKLLNPQTEQPENAEKNKDAEKNTDEKTVTAADQWQWVKVGPVKAVTAYPECDLTLAGNAKTTVWVDKVVLSTNDALDDDALNTMEN